MPPQWLRCLPPENQGSSDDQPLRKLLDPIAPNALDPVLVEVCERLEQHRMWVPPWHVIVQAAQRLARQHSVYFGVALQQPTCAPGQCKRSRNSTAHVIPGLWFDLDLSYGQHAASTLPTSDREALDFLATLPTRPSLIVHSGGGLYGYWLFKEPYVITTDTEHEAMAQLSKQFTHTLVTAGKTHAWTLDGLGDLGGHVDRTRLIGYCLCTTCFRLPDDERSRRIEATLAAGIVGRHN